MILLINDTNDVPLPKEDDLIVGLLPGQTVFRIPHASGYRSVSPHWPDWLPVAASLGSDCLVLSRSNLAFLTQARQAVAQAQSLGKGAVIFYRQGQPVCQCDENCFWVTAEVAAAVTPEKVRETLLAMGKEHTSYHPFTPFHTCMLAACPSAYFYAYD